MGEKKEGGLLSRFGKKVSGALESVDGALDDAKDKISDAVKGDATEYVDDVFESMDQMTGTLNEFNKNPDIKEFEVIYVGRNIKGQFELLLKVTTK